MQTPEFFISKAKNYISEFEKILENHISFIESIKQKDSFDFKSDKPYKIQSDTIHKLVVKSKLLFLEFDNGKLFETEMDKVNHTFDPLDDKKTIRDYIEILNSFVTHISEFRT